VGYHVADLWGQKINEAQTSNQLAGWLEQDLHRYVPCSPQGAELDLCLPAAASAGSGRAVTYTAVVPGGGCPCSVVRTDLLTQRRSVVTRDLLTPPVFDPVCGAAGGAEPGYLEVSGLAYRPVGQAPAPTSTPPPLLLYFRAPVGSST